MTKPVDEIIKSLDTEPEKWTQLEHTLNYKGNKVELWTSNIPYLNTGIYTPPRRIGWVDKFRLQWAINRWHRNQPIMPKEQKHD